MVEKRLHNLDFPSPKEIFPRFQESLLHEVLTDIVIVDFIKGVRVEPFAVTGVTAVKTTAIADGTYTNGWIYVFNITVPSTESNLSMKFADWTSDVGSNTLAAANNMRISSAQADNGGATVTVTAANTYTLPTLNMVTDLDPLTVGDQVQVTVEVSVPSTTVDGSYSTNYGVKTQ